MADPVGTVPIRRVAAALGLATFAVSVARLAAEKQGWVAPTSGGQAHWLGISWLPIPIGAALGLWLAGRGERPSARAAWLPLACLTAAVAVAFAAFQAFRGRSFAYSAVVMMVAWPVAARVAVRAWPALFAVLWQYALWARIGVVALTVVVALLGWEDTHYTRAGPPDNPVEGSIWLRVGVLTLAQLLFWIPFTMLAGGVFGGLAGVLRRRARTGA